MTVIKIIAACVLAGGFTYVVLRLIPEDDDYNSNNFYE